MNFDAANNKDAGFVKIWQSLRNWEWIDDPNMLALWVHLLLKANWKDNNWKGRIIKRGQCVIGRYQLSEQTGISERSLRTCLERLKSTSEVSIKTTSKYSIVTIVNYDFYNPLDKEATIKTTSKPSLKRPATDQRPTTLKEGEESLEWEEGNIIPKAALKKKSKLIDLESFYKSNDQHEFKDKCINYALNKGYEIGIARQEFESFENWAYSKNTKYANWSRAFNNWVTGQYSRLSKGIHQQPLNGERNNGTYKNQPSALEVITKINDRTLTEAERDEADSVLGIKRNLHASNYN